MTFINIMLTSLFINAIALILFTLSSLAYLLPTIQNIITKKQSKINLTIHAIYTAISVICLLISLYAWFTSIYNIDDFVKEFDAKNIEDEERLLSLFVVQSFIQLIQTVVNIKLLWYRIKYLNNIKMTKKIEIANVMLAIIVTFCLLIYILNM